MFGGNNDDAQFWSLNVDTLVWTNRITPEIAAAGPRGAMATLLFGSKLFLFGSAGRFLVGSVSDLLIVDLGTN